MSRNRYPIRAALERGDVIGLDHLRAAGVRIDRLIARLGVTPRHLESFLAGEKYPAAWIRREVAQAAGMEPESLFPPRESEVKRVRAPDAFDDRVGRRAAQNSRAGQSRGARLNRDERY